MKISLIVIKLWRNVNILLQQTQIHHIQIFYFTVCRRLKRHILIPHLHGAVFPISYGFPRAINRFFIGQGKGFFLQSAILDGKIPSLPRIGDPKLYIQIC